MNVLKKILLLTLTLLTTTNIFATDTAPKKKNITGTVIDKRDGKPVEFATVAIYTVADHSLINGGITDEKGVFAINNIAQGNYQIEIAYIGYTTTIQTITVDATDLNLGKINLAVDEKMLATVDVVADKSAVDYRIDKKVVNVSQQLNALSGMAVDVLENVPSIKVDIDGNVSMRGSSSFTVLIDGRPTPLDANDVLRTIPASSIENIEIITNPSAKYEPDGATGILNIITKKNALVGLSGVLNVSAGIPKWFGSNFTLDYRSGKWHVFGGAHVRAHENESQFDRERWVGIDTINYTISTGKSIRSGKGYGFNGGFDYQIGEKTNLGVNFRLGFHDNDNASEMAYKRYFSYGTDTNFYDSYSNSSHGGNYRSIGMFLHKDFEEDEHELDIQVNYNGRDNSDESENYQYKTDGSIDYGQVTEQSGPGGGLRFQIDYTRPLGGPSKLSAGAQGRFQPSTDEYSVSRYDTASKELIHQDKYSYKTDYLRQIYSIYAMFSSEWGNFGYQGGLRGEYTYQDLKLSGENGSFHLAKPALFPTLHVSYQLPADQQVMLSYTRRINRARPFQMQPYVIWTDAYSVRQGNPDISPEAVNSIDFGYQKKFGSNFVALDVYYRITQDKIENVQRFYEGHSDVIMHTIANVGTDYATGAELTLNYEPIKWYQLNLSGDLYDYRKEGKYNGEDFSQRSFNWNVRMNNIVKIGNYTRMQIDLNYRSKSVTTQGYEKAFFTVNAGVKCEMFDRKLSTTLQARNVFGTIKREGVSEGTGFYNRNKFKPQWPNISLMVSYRLNNYKDRSNGGGDENGSDMGGYE